MAASTDSQTGQLVWLDASQSVENALLAASWLFLGANFLALSIVRGDASPQHWLPLALWSVCALAGKLILDRCLPVRDRLLFPLSMLLSGWGITLVDRLLPAFGDRQAAWLVVATAGMLTVALFPQPLRWLRQYRYLTLVIGLLLLVGTIVLGTNPSGLAGAPELWLGFGSIFFQPSEALKIILVAFLSSYLAQHYPTLRARQLRGIARGFSFSPRIIGPTLLMWGLSIVILIWQRDLGTAVLFFVVFLILLYIASGSRVVALGGAVLIALAAVIAYDQFGVVRLRVDIWLNPWPEADGRAFQIVQSLMAFAAGGIGGQGIAQGSPFFIPVAHSDFAFASLAEEWGFLGVMTALVCLAALVTRGLSIAARQTGYPFRALLAVGLSSLIGTQSLLIIGGVLKLLPLTGVTLPFISYGGSSLLASFVIIGLLLRLSAPE